jgi:hypothetical protein
LSRRQGGIGALCAAIILGLASSFASAQEEKPAAGAGEAAPVGSKKIWTLDFEAQRPRRLTLGREPDLETYWVVPFTLTNKDADDHAFFLEVSAKDDKKNEYRNVAQDQVKDVVRRKLGVRKTGVLWTAEDYTVQHEPIEVPPTFPHDMKLPVIKAGESVRCVAIFRGPNVEADRLTVTFRGLTSDVVAAKTDKPNERKVTERALVLDYERPGDEFHRSSDAIEYVGRQWVVLERLVKTDLE